MHLTLNVTQHYTNVPSVRQGHTQVLFNNHLYIYSGRTNGDKTTRTRSYVDDMFKYDIEQEQWIQVNHTNVPLARHNHSAIVHNDQMIVFGGSGEQGFFDDLLVFDFKNETWSTLVVHGSQPHKRHGHSAILVDHRMIIFGGHYTPFEQKKKTRIFFNDVWEFDLKLCVWREIKCNGTSIPIGRTWHSCIYNDTTNRMIVFGGWWSDKYEHYLNDLYTLDLSSYTWTKMKCNGGIPYERNRVSLVSITPYQMILQGGNYFNTRTRESKWFDDAYLLELCPSDSSTATWTSLVVKNPVVLSDHTATFVDNKIYLFGGEVRRKRFNHIIEVLIQME
jgi:N-acetylneuraminic acid mutarotase